MTPCSACHVASIAQATFDAKWRRIRDVTFHSIERITSSVSLSELLHYPPVFEGLCRQLSNWYLFSYNDAIALPGDESFFEESCDDSAISTKKYMSSSLLP